MSILNISILLLYLFAMLGMGSLILRKRFQATHDDLIVPFIINFYFGIGTWYLIVNFLSLKGLFKRDLVLLILVMSSIYFFKKYGSKFKELKTLLLKIRNHLTTHSLNVCFFSIVALFLVINGFFGIGKSVIGDASAFYLNIAKTLASAGLLFPLSGYEDFSAIGLLGEFQISTLLLFNAEDAARILSYFVFLPAVILLVDWARNLGASLTSQVFTVITVFGSTAICLLFGDGKTDLIAASLSLASYYLIINRDNSYVVSGLMIGFACVAKISFLVSMGPGIAIIIFTKNLHENHCNFRKSIKKLIIKYISVGVPFLLVVSTHMLKNHLILNNFLAPFNNNKLAWDSDWFSPTTISRIKLLYPFIWFYGDFWAQYGDLSITILMFTPFVFSKKILNIRLWTNTELTLVTALSGLASWFLINPSFVAPRYILGTLLLFVPVSMLGLSNFHNSFISTKVEKNFFALLLTALCVVARVEQFESVLSWDNVYNSLKESKNKCFRDGIHCEAALAINQDAPLGARILNFNYYTLWLRPDLLQVMSSFVEKNKLPSAKNSENWKFYYERGFDYLFIDRSTHKAIVDSLDLSSLPKWIKLEKIYEKGTVSVFKVYYDQNIVKNWPRLLVRRIENHWSVVR